MKGDFFIFIFSLLLIFSLGTFMPISAQKPSPIIESVDIQGNRIYNDEDYFKFLKIKRGQKYEQHIIEEDLKTLRLLDFLDERKVKLIIEPVSKNKMEVIFQILELPIITEVKIEGLKYFTEQEILTLLKTEKIEAEKPYSFNKIKKAREKLGVFFAERGFFDVRMSVSEEEVSATNVKIGFLIDEMPNDDEKETDN